MRDAIAGGELREIDADVVSAAVEGGIAELVLALGLRPTNGSPDLLCRFVDLIIRGAGRK